MSKERERTKEQEVGKKTSRKLIKEPSQSWTQHARKDYFIQGSKRRGTSPKARSNLQSSGRVIAIKSLAEGADIRRAQVIQREKTILETLEVLGFSVAHTASLVELRNFSEAKRAVEALYDEFGNDVSAFIAQPLVDYDNKSVQDLVARYGVRALDAVRSDIEYPTPA